MNAKTMSLVLAAVASMSAGVAHAELPSFEAGGATFRIYGNIDEYLNFMRSSSGKSLNALQDGGFLRTRLGVAGEKPVDDGIAIKFQLEQGLTSTSGEKAEGITSNRLFDRQAWAGIKTQYGEFRAGRQNSAVFYRGNYIDFTARTMGSVVNAFGVPSRYDNDLAWISPRWSGVLLEAHYSFANTRENETTNQGVYQLAADYENGPFRVGYAGLGGKAANGAKVDKTVFYNNLYANYNYGNGKIYATYVRSNNNGCATVKSDGTCDRSGLLNGTTPLGNIGGGTVGTVGTANTYYNIYQLSADYKLTQKLRVGALYGIIDADGDKGASGWAVGAYYDIFKDTMVYALADVLANETNAGFRPAGSAGLQKNFSASASNGESIRGIQLGFVYKF
jgi:predicted porin